MNIKFIVILCFVTCSGYLLSSPKYLDNDNLRYEIIEIPIDYKVVSVDHHRNDWKPGLEWINVLLYFPKEDRYLFCTQKRTNNQRLEGKAAVSIPYKIEFRRSEKLTNSIRWFRNGLNDKTGGE